MFSTVLVYNSLFPVLVSFKGLHEHCSSNYCFVEKQPDMVALYKNQPFLQWQSGGHCGTKVAASRDLLATWTDFAGNKIELLWSIRYRRNNVWSNKNKSNLIGRDCILQKIKPYHYKKMCGFRHTSTSLCQKKNLVWLLFLWCGSPTSYLFFFSSQKATARMRRTPRMQATTTETTKPRKRGKAYKTVNFIYLGGEG